MGAVEGEQGELAGLKFGTEEDFGKCVSVYTYGRPGGYFAAGGGNTVIVSQKAVGWLSKQLQSAHVSFETVPVLSMGDLSPEQLREYRERWSTPSRPDSAARKKALKDLRRRHATP